MPLPTHSMARTVKPTKPVPSSRAAAQQRSSARLSVKAVRPSSPVSLQDVALVRVPWLKERGTATSNLERASKQDSTAVSVTPVLPNVESALELSYEAEVSDTLPQWAGDIIRQVPQLPNGRLPMLKLLTAMVELSSRAMATSQKHRWLLEAYQELALVDLTAYAWQEQLKDVEHGLAKDIHNAVYRQQHLEARMALSGCRYLRIHAVNDLAKQAHMLVDGQGTSSDLDLAALPAPHIVGINWSQLLQQGLGVNLANPQISNLSEEQLQELQHLSFDEYFAKLQDPSLCGEWEFEFFGNGASWVPAPFAKFGTKQLAGLLTPDVILSSLRNGVWGRALLAPASEVGLSLDFMHLAGGEPEVAVQAGAGSVGSASAWLFLQAQLAPSQAQFAKLKALAVAVLATAATLLQQQQQQQ